MIIITYFPFFFFLCIQVCWIEGLRFASSRRSKMNHSASNLNFIHIYFLRNWEIKDFIRRNKLYMQFEMLWGVWFKGFKDQVIWTIKIDSFYCTSFASKLNGGKSSLNRNFNRSIRRPYLEFNCQCEDWVSLANAELMNLFIVYYLFNINNLCIFSWIMIRCIWIEWNTQLAI